MLSYFSDKCECLICQLTALYQNDMYFFTYDCRTISVLYPSHIEGSIVSQSDTTTSSTSPLTAHYYIKLLSYF